MITANRKRRRRKKTAPRPKTYHGRIERKPKLRFTPTAWSKLLFLRDRGETEIGGFGLSAADDLSLITDIRLVEQDCTPVTVSFRDEAVADFFDEQVIGRHPKAILTFATPPSQSHGYASIRVANRIAP